MRTFVMCLMFCAVTATPCDFDSWAVANGRRYADAADRAFRKQIFDSNCARWRQLNSIEKGARFGPDDFADRTPAEFSASMGNCYGVTLPLTPVSRPDFDEAVSTNVTVRPDDLLKSESVDWRDHDGKSYVTPVKNQGAFGTCWSFGVAENLEGLNVRQGHALTNISEQEFISCCKDCQGHAADASFEWLVNNTGGRPALEASYPYNGSAKAPCLATTAPRAPVTLHSWGRIQDDGSGVPVAEGLVAHGPMGMGVDATCFHGYHGGVIRNCTSKGVDHAVLMVAAGTDPETDVKYFTIKNSWGAKWGENGYVRIEQGKTWWGKLSTIFTE